MGMKFKCPKCGKEIVITVEFLKVGDIAKCRNCGAEVVIPADATEIHEESESEKTEAPKSPRYIEEKRGRFRSRAIIILSILGIIALFFGLAFVGLIYNPNIGLGLPHIRTTMRARPYEIVGVLLILVAIPMVIVGFWGYAQAWRYRATLSRKCPSQAIIILAILGIVFLFLSLVCLDASAYKWSDYVGMSFSNPQVQETRVAAEVYQIMSILLIVISVPMIIVGFWGYAQVRRYRTTLMLFKKCPFCAELIKREAKVCRYCGRELDVEETV